MKKQASIILSAALLLSTVTACGGSGYTAEQKANALIIEVFGGGYGTNMIFDLANAYTQKTGKQVIVTPQTGTQGINNMSTNLRSYEADADIFFTKAALFSDVYKGTISIKGQKYDCLLENLTDLYNTEIEGEGILYKDKMFDTYSDYYNMDDASQRGKYYFTSWASGMVGFVVNMDVWNSAWNIPRTTDELFEVCDAIKAAEGDVAPFIYSSSDEYWTMLSHVWMTQYDGIENMDNFYKGVDYDGRRYTDNMAAYDGYMKMLEFYDKLLKHENGYMHSKSKGADFTNMQGLFLQGKAAITPNGDWIEGEMKYNYPNANIKMIKTPVISAVAEKCTFYSATDKAGTDAKLRELIDYVDANASGYTNMPSGCKEEDVDVVREARSVELAGAGPEHIGIIPCYSNQKEAAKDFLLFMASDEGMRIYRESTGGCELPFNATQTVDANTYSNFRKSVRDVIDSSVLRMVNMKDKIYSIGGINVYLYNNSKGRFVTCFSAEYSEDYVTPLAYYTAEMSAIRKALPTAKQKIGL